MPKKRLNAKQIIGKLKIDNSKDSVQHVLNQLEENDKIVFVKDGKYRLNKSAAKTDFTSQPSQTFEGRIDMAKSGSAFLIVDKLENDLFISNRYLKGAMNGDIVEVSATFPKEKRRGEARVKKILKRSISSAVGKIYFQKRYALVDVLNTKQPLSIMVKPGDTLKAKDGDVVTVDITQWGTAENKTIWGKVKEIIDPENMHEITMQSILSMNGFDAFYPDQVLDELKGIPDEPTEEDFVDRRDFRKVTTFTIDPDTAKDFDDALSIEYKEDGVKEIGIHIADVTHYVEEGTALDKEAFRRSTSVYLVDRCIAMLPEKLSNNLCSLNPEVDRLSFSAVFTFDKKNQIIDRWFGKSIIYSDKRFTYLEAQKVIDTGKGPFAKELKDLNRTAKVLREGKFKNGAINFDSEELKFQLDEKGKPIGLFVKERKDTHLLVEDFMLLANREVAAYIGDRDGKEIPFVYRIHDAPDPDRLAELSLFAKELNFHFKFQSPKEIKDSINLLAKQKKENEALKLLEPLAIRCMAKAIYTTENIGHFGLAFTHYGHFTSPIRRYADVLVHRILFENLKQPMRVEKELLESKCKHISLQEKKAKEAERESIKYKQVEFMADRVGETFEGVISGIIERGIFVEATETKAEGFIPFHSLYDDFSFTGSKYQLKGKATGDVLSYGDKIKIKLLEANLEDKQLEFRLVE